MELIEDIITNRSLLEESVRLFGYAPEHNVDWYEYGAERGQKAVFIHWRDTTGLLTYKGEDVWYIFSEPLAPVGEGGKRIIEFSTYALETLLVKKVMVELRQATRRDVLRLLPSTLRAASVNYVLVWAVMNMRSFDTTLQGGHWKSIRNARGKFYREHRAEVVPATSVDKGRLHSVVDVWQKQRRQHDQSKPSVYHKLIDSNFKGMKSARALVVDGKPVGFNAGYEIPNSSQSYYSCAGTHDYSLKDLGIILYLEDLEWIRGAGYEEAEMGGSYKDAVNFKNQFLPESWYKDYTFSIVRS